MNHRIQFMLRVACGALLGLALLPGIAVADDGENDAGIDFVPNVEEQFAELALRPEALGFHIGESPKPEQQKHYQGMVRLRGPGTPYLFVSRSGNCPGFGWCQLQDDNPGNLLIVKMASRNTSGERMRSNRLLRNSDIDGTAPGWADTVVAYLSFDGNKWPAWGHPGGMQLVGNILAVPFETRYPNNCIPNCETAGGEDENAILFFDVSNPESPSIKSTLNLTKTADWSAGLLGLTPVLNASGECCNYLMLVTGAKGKIVRIYRSNPTDAVSDTTDLADPGLTWALAAERNESQIESCLGGEDWHTGVGDSHQTLNFVRQGNLEGPLYLIGARNTTALPSGDDYLDLYLFDEDAVEDPAKCLFTYRASTHFTSKPMIGGGDSACFAAAGGVYVSPSGELIFYSAEYDNAGPSETVRFGEWRHRDVVRFDSPTLRPTTLVGGPFQVDEGGGTSLFAQGASPQTKAWMMLFEDDGLGLSLPGTLDKDDWFMVDYEDWNEDDFYDFRKEDYSDDAGSWRWFAPVGCTLRANDDDFGDDNFPGEETKTLPGKGSVQEDADLNEVRNDGDSTDMDDAITSMQFFPNCDSYYDATMNVLWDLDADSSFETPATSPRFSAAALDGPSEVWVSVRAQHPTDSTALGIGAATQVRIQVNNVPPTAEAGPNFSANEGELLSRTFAFSDPGAPDTHVAEIDWGDEIGPVVATVSKQANATVGTVASDHTYGDNGTFEVHLCVTDDDGGEGCDMAKVAVANVPPTLTVNTGDQIHFLGGGDAFLGRRRLAQVASAAGFDVGSDDLQFSWSILDTYFGGGSVHADSASYCNDPSGSVCPDPLPSSQAHHFPMQVSDETGATLEKPGVFDIGSALADDDGGDDSAHNWLVITDDRTCTDTPSAWHLHYAGEKPPTLDADFLDRYLHVVEFASASLSELFCATPHDLPCLRSAVVDLLSDNSVDLGDGDPSHTRGKTLAQIVAAWLNFASGAILWNDELEPGGELFHDAMERWEAAALDPSSSRNELVAIRLGVQQLNTARACPK